MMQICRIKQTQSENEASLTEVSFVVLCPVPLSRTRVCSLMQWRIMHHCIRLDGLVELSIGVQLRVD